MKKSKCLGINFYEKFKTAEDYDRKCESQFKILILFCFGATPGLIPGSAGDGTLLLHVQVQSLNPYTISSTPSQIFGKI